MTAPALPETALKRLEAREKTQRSQTKGMTYKDRPLKVEQVSVLGLWLLQQAKCTCGCGADLNPLAEHPNPESIVIAHVLLRSKGGGHTIQNVRLWPKRCNDREAALEKKAAGVGNRTGFSEDRKAAPKAEKAKTKIQGRGFQKPPPGYKHRWSQYR